VAATLVPAKIVGRSRGIRRYRATIGFRAACRLNSTFAIMPKRRVTIEDDFGEHLAALYLPCDTTDLEDGQLEGLCAPCISTLRGRSFARSSLYSAMLQESDLSGCNFQDADLRGANLMGAIMVGANFCRANLSVDNLGGSTKLQGADLTSAILNQCNLAGATYDSNTLFPQGFNPEAAGMLNVG